MKFGWKNLAISHMTCVNMVGVVGKIFAFQPQGSQFWNLNNLVTFFSV